MECPLIHRSRIEKLDIKEFVTLFFTFPCSNHQVKGKIKYTIYLFPSVKM